MGANRAVSEELLALQTAAAATGNGVVADVSGVSAVLVQITGTFSATVTFEVSLDGTNYVAVEATNLGDRSVSSAPTAAGIWVVPVAGAAKMRARVSTYASGNVTVTSRALPPGVAEAVAADASFSAAPNVTTTPAAAGTATLANVNDSASNATLAAANASRIGLLVFNDSTSDLYLKYGATATASSFTVKIPAAGYWEMPTPVYKGIVDGIWSADASGAARVTELT